jgi:predicted dinucleotide-binding enzyme
MELLGTLSGGAQIAAAMSTDMAPHPSLGWSHHTTYDHLVSVDGDDASIDTQFITFDIAATRKPEGGWPAGTFGAQGAIKPIESGYYRFIFRRTDGVWRVRHLDVIHDIPYVFGAARRGEAGSVPGMATLGLIGSGHIGGTLARLAVDAGLDVVLSNSRGPQTLSDLVDELGPQARAATPAQAAAAGDWVVVTIPVGAIGKVPREPLVGKTVIDTGNYFAPRDGTIPELEAQELTDSEILQRHLADAHVVKAFNNINYQHLKALPRPVDAADRTALPIAGNDPGAKKHAAELLSLLGYDSVDMGPLTESWRSQPGTPVFCAPYAVTKDDQYRTQPAAPASAAEVGAALASARR